MKKFRLTVTLLAAAALLLGAVFAVCSCGERESDGTFVYTLNDDGESYTVAADVSTFGDELTIPSSYKGKPVVAIANRGFEACRGFETVNVPASIKRVGYEAFKGCADLANVVWESDVDVIGNSAFRDCDNLISMDLPKGIDIISNSMFYNCDKLESVTVPNGVLTVVDNAFGRCISLEEIKLPDTVKKIGDAAFYNCVSLEEVRFGDSSALKEIGREAFYGCVSLEEFDFYDKFERIGESAFAYCKSLRFVSFFGSALREIGPSAFIACDSLDGVEIADIANWCGVRFLGNDYSNPIYVGQRIFKNGELVLRLEIPYGVETISPRAFKNATRIVSVTLPSTFNYKIGAVGEDAFRYCYKLAEVHNYSTMQISPAADKLAQFGYIAAYMRGDAFNYPEGSFPSSGEEYHYGESGRVYSKDEYKNHRTYIYTYGENDEFVFYKNGQLHYLLEYIGEDSEIVLPDFGEKYGIFTGAFFGQRGVSKIVVPDCVNEIWHFAFYSCKDLDNIYIPESVTSFGERLFGKCDGLVIDLEADKHKLGWQATWADPTEDEVITPVHGQKKEDLPWVMAILNKEKE